MSQLTLLDLAKRTGSDAEIGLIEDVVAHAPEMRTLPVRPISGVAFKTTLRTGFPMPSFRGMNEGTALVKSTYEQKLAECFFLDAQLQVDEALPDAEDRSIGDVLADETSGALMGIGLKVGAQLYYGLSADSKGFQGLSTLIGTDAALNLSAGANANTANTTSAYLVFEDLKGVHFVAGRTALPMAPGRDTEVIAAPLQLNGEWRKQQIVDANDANKRLTALVNNVKGWLGLAYGSRYSAFRLRNINASNPLTDAKAAELLAKVPLWIRNSGRLRWYINRNAAFYVQNARSSATTDRNDTRGANFVPTPTEIQGVPVSLTDSITTTETAVSV
jgi:hypothetical protein